MDGQKQLFCIENPLLDISVSMPDNALLEKYKLVHGQACLASPEQMPLYDEIWAMENKETIPGGSALNTARCANYVLKAQEHANKVMYYGSIGHCEKGETLQKVVKDEGVNGNFHKDADTPTGTCAVVVVEKERALCANLAAACKYDIEHLRNNMDAVRNSTLIYSTAFFITSNKDALHEVAEFASTNNVPFGFNLSAVFLLQFELDAVLKTLPHCDFVFCNEDEAAAFAKSQEKEGASLQDVARMIARWEKKNTQRPRVAIVTQGADPVIVATHTHGSEEVDVIEHPVAKLEKDQIVDTNGAGDSFVGGFLS
jgi:adenosine kinase